MVLNYIVNPTKEELKLALQRPSLDKENLQNTIASIFEKVETFGDEALVDFTKNFEGISITNFEVTELEIEEAESLVSIELKEAIQIAANNIYKFHAAQLSSEEKIETIAGVTCWRKSIPISSVGLYIPGGTAPLFSTVLMLGIPAKICENPNVILCSPANKEGKIHPAILFAAKIAGIKRIFKLGGAQAIAAMSIGTNQIPKVDKLFGPGNQYVTSAKQFAQSLGIAIDMPAGPSEVLVAADNSIPAAFVAADLLAQAEHGSDSQVVFLTDSEDFVQLVDRELEKQINELPRANFAIEALKKSHSLIVSSDNWTKIINQYAPEHLILMGKYESEVVEQVVNAGSVFLGQFTAESFGDYASGTNHTLPTNGFAKAYSGVSLDSFVKKITFQRINKTGLLNLGQIVVTLAEAEELQAHANAIKVRLNFVANNSLFEEETSKTKQFTFIRKDLENVVPYSSARDEFEGKGDVFLDANENGLVEKYNRYPDPFQKELKAQIAQVKRLNSSNLVVGNGSDEILDLIFRLICTPFRDKVAFLNPSYGMYAVLAKLNGLETISIDLDEKFKIDTNQILDQAANSKLLVLCNPNNPTGKLIQKSQLLEIVRNFKGVVVIDEAYIDFCSSESLADNVNDYPNLLIVQTLSKAYGMAGLRVGMAVCNEKWVRLLNSIKPPYNLSSLVQDQAIELLKASNWEEIRSEIKHERSRIEAFLKNHQLVEEVFESEANFVLFRIKDADLVYSKLLTDGIVVRNRSLQHNCSNTLRVSVGSKTENNRFIHSLSQLA